VPIELTAEDKLAARRLNGLLDYVEALIKLDERPATQLAQHKTMLAGDVDSGKAILRDYIKATVGFEKLGEETGTQPKSLIRMFGPRGNPQARNFFGIIGYLQKQAGVELHVRQGPG
jgi:hypothetical protein